VSVPLPRDTNDLHVVHGNELVDISAVDEKNPMNAVMLRERERSLYNTIQYNVGRIVSLY